jgi:hypothetical protein
MDEVYDDATSTPQEQAEFEKEWLEKMTILIQSGAMQRIMDDTYKEAICSGLTQ